MDRDCRQAAALAALSHPVDFSPARFIVALVFSQKRLIFEIQGS
jgi:hypothetical protein